MSSKMTPEAAVLLSDVHLELEDADHDVIHAVADHDAIHAVAPPLSFKVVMKS